MCHQAGGRRRRARRSSPSWSCTAAGAVKALAGVAAMRREDTSALCRLIRFARSAPRITAMVSSRASATGASTVTGIVANRHGGDMHHARALPVGDPTTQSQPAQWIGGRIADFGRSRGVSVPRAPSSPSASSTSPARSVTGQAPATFSVRGDVPGHGDGGNVLEDIGPGRRASACGAVRAAFAALPRAGLRGRTA